MLGGPALHSTQVSYPQTRPSWAQVFGPASDLMLRPWIASTIKDVEGWVVHYRLEWLGAERREAVFAHDTSGGAMRVLVRAVKEDAIEVLDDLGWARVATQEGGWVAPGGGAAHPFDELVQEVVEVYAQHCAQSLVVAGRHHHQREVETLRARVLMHTLSLAALSYDDAGERALALSLVETCHSAEQLHRVMGSVLSTQ